MLISVNRRKSNKDTETTISDMYVDGKFYCYVLEDMVRDLKEDGSGKIFGKTAIPAGRYKVILTYSHRFKRILPELIGVKFFVKSRMHGGNTKLDTEGCLLVAKNTDSISKVWDCKDVLSNLIKIMKVSKECWIEIKDYHV
jgi:hypothetical protein